MSILYKRTNKGRVVYDRPLHRMKVKDVVRMTENLTNIPDEDLIPQAIACNALFEVVKNGIYPVYLNELLKAQPLIVGEVLNAFSDEAKGLLKDFVASICDKIGDRMGIPANYRKLVLDYLFNHIFNVVWDITGVLFNQKDSKKGRK